MATTLRDVATRLNLSPALVSRVLNNKPGVWASEETRRRRCAAARDEIPPVGLRALSTGRTLQPAASRHQYQAVVLPPDHPADHPTLPPARS